MQYQQIGITGGIGSGKSTIAKIFEHYKIPVYYSDSRSKMLSDSNPIIKQKVIELLGDESYSSIGMNRPFIASKVFADKALLNQLNSIIHPIVAQDYKNWANYSLKSAPFVCKEAAILFESGADKGLDAVICVTAPKDIRIQRVMMRDGLNKEAVEQRINNQWPEEKKIKLSEFAINNNGKQFVTPQVEIIIEKIKNKK